MGRRSQADLGFHKNDVNLWAIAKKLGVSSSTVSRAISNVPGVHPRTRERVLEVARTMGYYGLARERVSKSARTVLVLSQVGDTSLDGAYYSGLSSASVILNCHLVMHHYRTQDGHHVLDPMLQPPVLASGDVQGAILLHRWPEKVVQSLSQRFPLVSVVHTYEGDALDTIGINEREGMSALVSHLQMVQPGPVGFFGFCKEMSWARSRYGAYVEALATRGLEFDPSNVVEISLAEALVEKPNARLNSLKKVFTRFEQGVRTWVCACEILGLSLREGALERALQIPEDIMITGFHADTQHYQHGGHTLTSTLSNSEELGGAALRRLINRIENPREMRRTILLPCGFVQGKSTRQYGAEGDRVASCSALIPAKYPNYTHQDGV